METVDIILPKLGESILSARIVRWLKKKGDSVALDEPIVEVSTDKVNSEIPSPVAGILEEIVALEEEEIEVGAVLARLIPSSAASPSAPAKAIQQEVPSSERSCGGEKSQFLSAATLRQAELEGISLETVKSLSGTGEGGRVTKKDVEEYAKQKKANDVKVESPLEERVKLSGMRRAIAENMVRSFYEAPHASIVAEADVTAIMETISKEKERFLEAHKAKLTITAFLIYALTKALQQFPLLNASLEGETIVMKRYIHTGIAVNIDKGLIVPVIKNCQERNLVSIAKAVGDLALRARTHQLTPDEVKEGTITVTNFGMTGALIGVPIIRYPEVAILGAGSVQKRVVVREDESLAIRSLLYLTLTFDHRVIDGIYGCEFLNTLKNNLETLVME